MTKRSKHPVYDDPSAFKKQLPRIVPDADAKTPMALLAREKGYKMGAVRAMLTTPGEGVPGYFLSVHGRDRYPTWDEIVWLRYNLIPDAARMVLILPNLNAYINQEDTHHKFVFTMEQQGWVLDPQPACSLCGRALDMQHVDLVSAQFACYRCQSTTQIDLTTWNERHGNGFLARTEAQP